MGMDIWRAAEGRGALAALPCSLVGNRPYAGDGQGGTLDRQGEPMRALVIDDSRAMRMLLRKIMTHAGYEVTEAENGQDGLATLKELDSVDVMLVDWNMPEMSGIEFVRAVRSEGAYSDVPLMMVTTEDGMDHIVEALEAGANEYVMKPFTEDSIREKLELLGLGTA